MAILLVGAGAVYGYVRYQWGQVKTIACAACAAADDSQPFNVLVVGSDSRAGDTGAAAKAFGTATQVGGQRSDTLKILHVDPATGTARLLSIPRDTFVQLSGMSSGTGLSTDNKINTAFNNGPNALVKTIENTFGIPIEHFVILNFTDEINLVNAVGGINLDFPYPVRDDDNGNNNSGLKIPTAGCQTLTGNMALALSRSRYYQYYEYGYWHYDPTSDLGRIERQNIIVEAVINKAKSDYNPLHLNSFLTSLVHDITVDQSMSFGTMFSLAEHYHAFSGSQLSSLTLPTVNGVSNSYGDVQVVQEPEAQQTIAQFLGTQPQQVTTPPLNQYGDPIQIPSASSPSGSSASSSATTASSGGTGATSAGPPSSSVPPYDPRPC